MVTINNVIGFSKRFSGVKKWIYSYLKKPIENATKTIEEGFSNHGVKDVNDGVCLEIKSLQSFSWPINLQKVWRRQLKTFRSTLTGQTVRFQSQQKRNVLFGQRNFFSKDFMWKRAKQGPLLAFGGFLFFQEDEYQMGITLQSQFNLYSNVCQNVKDLFLESCPEKHDSEQHWMDIDDIKFTRCMEIGKNKAVYDAKLKTSKRSLEEISTSVIHYEPSEADVFSFDSIPDNETSSDITVHVVPVLGTLENAGRTKGMFAQFDGCTFAVSEHGLFGDQTWKNRNHYSGIYKGLTRGQSSDLPVPTGVSGAIAVCRWKNEGIHHPNIMVMKGVLQASSQQISNCNLAGVIGIDSVFASLGMHLRQFICLVTQRYEMSLKDYLRRYKLDVNTCMVVLAQIFEVVAYLEDQSVVHRAISSENFFVESMNNNSYPHLLLGHFDNAHSTGNENGLLIPFQHETLDPRLSDLGCQAPEVSRAKPGKRALIDYRKADAWSAGILAYEVLTGSNKFKENKIDSRTFMEKEIPSLHSVPMPHLLKMIARLLLSVDPSKRLSANEAADMLHFEIFAESPMVTVTNQIPELCSWLTAHSAEMLARQQQDQVLVDLCRCFFRRIEPTNLFRSYKLWLLIKG